MSEHPYDDQAPDRHDGHGDEPEPTGHPDVDAVLGSLDDLQDRPVAEHVAVFEAAHDRLRAALADAGDEPSGS